MTKTEQTTIKKKQSKTIDKATKQVNKSTELKKEHEKSIKLTQIQNKKQGKTGEVRCSKLPQRFSKGDKKWPTTPGFKNINCCSSARGIFKGLSPMLLGPLTYEYESEGTFKITNLENMWQFSKVFPGEEDEKTGQPNTDFFKRRKEGWKDKKPHRHVKKGVKPLYAWWKGEKLSYFEARKNIYCKYYAMKIVETEAYKKLVEMLKDGYNIQILGYDGYDYLKEGKTLKDCFSDPRPFGHELVLCCLLTGHLVWEDDYDENNTKGVIEPVEQEEEEDSEEEDSEEENIEEVYEKPTRASKKVALDSLHKTFEGIKQKPRDYNKS
ncbi:hypothetical protein ABK040_006774 [Willaertia magna]